MMMPCVAGKLPVPIVAWPAQVTVFGREPVQISAQDPLADLPIEKLLADPDDVSPGTRIPPEYGLQSSRTVTFKLGALLTGQEKFFFQP